MVTITLPPELEQAITEQAIQQGTTPELVALDGLLKLYLPAAPAVGADGETLAHYWAEYIGSVDSSEIIPGGAHLSENTGRKFAELMTAKYRKSQP